MTTDKILYLIPYLLSFFLSLGVFLYAWRKRNYRSARELSFFFFGQTFWLFGYILEMIATDINVKILWDKMQWFGGVITLVSLPYFALRFVDLSLRHKPRFSALLAIIPTSFTLLILTDQYHHLLYPDPSLIQHTFFSELTYHFTWVVYAFGIYSYLVTIASFVFIIIKAPKTNKTQRMQITIISIGGLLPILGTIFTLTGIHILPERDVSPLVAAIGNLVLAWGMFRYHMFEMLPRARETLMENMDDLVIMLDAQDRLVQVNNAALRTLDLQDDNLIGLPVTEVFKEWTGLLAKLDPPQNFNTEEYIQSGNSYLHFDVKSTLVTDPNGDYAGRLLVARDITPYAELQWNLKLLNENLERRVQEQTKELADAYESTLEGWAKALELRDKETEGHSRRVVEEAVNLAQRLGVPEDEMIHLRRGAILHDIGKMAIPDEILHKPSTLTPEEWVIIKKHPVAAYELLKPIAYLQKAVDIPYCHHEHWDGSGYPRGLKGEEIPLAARIFSVVDVWDALLSDRSYSKAWSKDKVKAYIQENSGKLFDPKIVDVFIQTIGNSSEY